MPEADHEKYMRRCIALAKEGSEKGAGGPFAALFGDELVAA